VGPIEQRFTGCELDEARRKGVGFGASMPHLKEAFASAEEGCTRFIRRRRHSLQQKKEALERPLYDLGSGEVLLQFVLSSLRGGVRDMGYNGTHDDAAATT